jgi:hypothetical protein
MDYWTFGHIATINGAVVGPVKKYAASHDPETKVRQIPPLFPEKGC